MVLRSRCENEIPLENLHLMGPRRKDQYSLPPLVLPQRASAGTVCGENLQPYCTTQSLKTCSRTPRVSVTRAHNTFPAFANTLGQLLTQRHKTTDRPKRGGQRREEGGSLPSQRTKGNPIWWRLERHEATKQELDVDWNVKCRLRCCCCL